MNPFRLTYRFGPWVPSHEAYRLARVCAGLGALAGSALTLAVLMMLR